MYLRRKWFPARTDLQKHRWSRSSRANEDNLDGSLLVEWTGLSCFQPRSHRRIFFILMAIRRVNSSRAFQLEVGFVVVVVVYFQDHAYMNV